MTAADIYRAAILSLRARRIARELFKKYGTLDAYKMVRNRERVAKYDETYLLWTMVHDNLSSMTSAQILSLG